MTGGSSKKGDEVQARLVAFASSIIGLSTRLPRTPQGRHISLQIVRSGTAPAANYAEARGAESRADFVHKLAIVLKELNETFVWLEMIKQSGLYRADKLSDIAGENRELSRIINASIRTARHRK